MKLTIDRIILHKFRGITHENLLFNNNSVIVSGANGSGKSTIDCAWFWLMADCSETLVSNPPIFPLNAEEVNPSVEVILTVDGKQINLERRIKRTVKKSKTEGVADSVSFSSTYFVNGCEYGLRDFKQRIAEFGITERFVTLSHPDMFLSQKKDDMRKVLFGMAQAKTDYEIALLEQNTSDVAMLLKDYKFEEVEGMQKSVLRKIAENYGKSGEILNAKIEGLELSKVDLDFAELELLKNSIKEKQEKNEDARRVYNLITSEITSLDAKANALQTELCNLNEREKRERNELDSKIRSERRELEEKANSLDRNIKRMQSEADIYESTFRSIENETKKLEMELTKARTLIMDEGKTFCPVCNRKYAESKIATIKANFEADKTSRITFLEKQLKENASHMALKKSEKADLDKNIKKAMNDRAELETVLKTPINALEGNMEVPDKYGAERDRLKAEIEKLVSEISGKKATRPNTDLLSREESELAGQLRDCEIQLSKADDNNRIDEKIAELRELQKTYEQNKADAEKLLYELSLVQKRKNELLTEEINAHFKLVKFKFFDWQKNGEYKEVCVPQYQKKDLGVATNTGLEIRMKLDIIRGLQEYYGEYYPVFVDGAEALDETSMSQIQMDCQIVYLKVSEHKELVVIEQ